MLMRLTQHDDVMNSRKANELESRQEEPVLQSKKGEEGSRVDANEAGREEAQAKKMARRLKGELAQRDQAMESLSVRHLLCGMPEMAVNQLSRTRRPVVSLKNSEKACSCGIRM